MTNSRKLDGWRDLQIPYLAYPAVAIVERKWVKIQTMDNMVNDPVHAEATGGRCISIPYTLTSSPVLTSRSA